jgi:hypothetical protein
VHRLAAILRRQQYSELVSTQTGDRVRLPLHRAFQAKSDVLEEDVHRVQYAARYGLMVLTVPISNIGSAR